MLESADSSCMCTDSDGYAMFINRVTVRVIEIFSSVPGIPSLSSLIVCYMGFLVQGASYAVDLGNLYQVSLPAYSKQADERERLCLAACKTVMSRVAVSSKLGAGLKLSYADVEKYIQKYSYQVADRDFTLVDEGVSQARFNLMVEFVPELINQFLLDNGYVVWGSIRPLTIIWLAVGNDANKQVVNAETNLGLVDKIEQKTKKLGIPVIFPLLDLEDLGKIKLKHIWQQDELAIRVASQRYAADAIFALNLHQSIVGEWNAKAKLKANDSTQEWRGTGPNLEVLIDRNLDLLIDKLLSSYLELEQGDSRASFIISVSNITSLEDYAALLSYLNSLPSIASVMLQKLSVNTIELLVTPVHSKYAVRQDISMEFKLKNLGKSTGDVINYSWLVG